MCLVLFPAVVDVRATKQTGRWHGWHALGDDDDPSTRQMRGTFSTKIRRLPSSPSTPSRNWSFFSSHRQTAAVPCNSQGTIPANLRPPNLRPPRMNPRENFPGPNPMPVKPKFTPLLTIREDAACTASAFGGSPSNCAPRSTLQPARVSKPYWMNLASISDDC